MNEREGEDAVRVLLADDENLVRAGFTMLFSVDSRIEVVGEAENGAEAVALAKSLKPDVVLMDLHMPVLNGVEATKQITSSTSTRVLVLTTFDDDDHVVDSLTAGAVGFLLKTSDPAHLVHAIVEAARGHSVLAPEVTKQVIDRGVSNSASRLASEDQRRMLATLTEREQEILQLVAQGLSNGEIAELLTLGPATVKSHVSACLAKLQVRDRVQLVVFAFEAGAAGDPGTVEAR